MISTTSGVIVSFDNIKSVFYGYDFYLCWFVSSLTSLELSNKVEDGVIGKFYTMVSLDGTPVKTQDWSRYSTSKYSKRCIDKDILLLLLTGSTTLQLFSISTFYNSHHRPCPPCGSLQIRNTQ